MGKSKKHRSPSPEWKNLEAQCLWPEQIAYEIIRPCQLEKQSITQRAVEVGLHPRTIARKLERFQQLGLPGLVPDSPDDTVDHRRLPLEVREEILRLKAEYPAFIAHEIAVICAIRFQRASDTRVVQHVLNTYPSPTQPERRFPRAHGPDAPGISHHHVRTRSEQLAPDQAQHSKGSPSVIGNRQMEGAYPDRYLVFFQLQIPFCAHTIRSSERQEALVHPK